MPFEILAKILESIVEAGVDACPPLLIFLFVACMFISDGCLPKIGGILLIPIGIIALIVWLIL
ncbi:MAG: hypothetical protein SR2Q5_04480 [Quinella sp. 2Q5]|nr:hypothetical protein [Quinella sp. 2Q5]